MNKLTAATILLVLFLFSLTTCKKEALDPGIEDEILGLGLVEDHPDSFLSIPILDTTTFFEERGMGFEDSFSLEMPPILSQGGEGSCVAFASAYAMRSFQFHRDNNSPYIDNNDKFSPEFLYNSAKLPGNCRDAGMDAFSALTFLKNYGVSTWAMMPYTDENCSLLPNEAQKQNALLYKIDDFYRIKFTTVETLKRILQKQNPILISVMLDASFHSMTDKNVWRSKNGDIIGLHALVICGWDDSKNAWKVMNSYGTAWKDNGYGWIDYDYLDDVVLGPTFFKRMYVMKTYGPGARKPTISTVAYSNITVNAVTSGGNITSDGGSPVTSRGVCWSTSPNPAISSSKTTDGSGSGSFISNVTGLSPGTLYYLKAYATNIIGTSYGNQISFTTSSAGQPVLTTTGVTSITNTTALSGGNISSDGGSVVTARGICWSTEQNPSTANTKTIDGSGLGSFNSNMSGLEPNTQYYVRAYATNGAGTAYGQQVNFTTTGSTTGCGAVTTITDIDGNVYNVIEIGSQCWTKENLKVTKYRNGDLIPNVTDSTIWKNLSTGAWCYYDNNSSYNNPYGKLYNWYTINTADICPAGWHVPSETDWSELTTYLGGTNIAGGKMKVTDLWLSPNTGADNSSGFSGVPAGGRGASTGSFDDIGADVGYWSSTEFNASNAWYLYLIYNNSKANTYNANKKVGFSIRCVKD